MDQERGIEVSDSDPVRDYSIDEQKTLSLNLKAIETEVERGAFSSRRIDSRLYQDIHAAMFDGVRDHAGRIRSPGFGSEHVTFLGIRAANRDHVPPKLQEILQRAQRWVEQFDSLKNDPDCTDYEYQVLKVSLWTHAELIRLQPFEDGNKRVARTLLAVMLIKAGLQPVPLEATRNEYMKCLRHFCESKDLDPLIDLYLRLYASHLEEGDV